MRRNLVPPSLARNPLVKRPLHRPSHPRETQTSCNLLTPRLSQHRRYSDDPTTTPRHSSATYVSLVTTHHPQMQSEPPSRPQRAPGMVLSAACPPAKLNALAGPFTPTLSKPPTKPRFSIQSRPEKGIKRKSKKTLLIPQAFVPHTNPQLQRRKKQRKEKNPLTNKTAAVLSKIQSSR